MSFTFLTCPACGEQVKSYRNPLPAVDIIIETADGIVLIERKNDPKGWALPGGFVDYGETLEQAAVREAKEETSLSVTSLRLLGCYSDPQRDPRRHIISTVFVAQGDGTPQAGDDAASLDIFPLSSLPEPLCFDHRRILEDYERQKKAGDLSAPCC
jgi:8-oxo-dGTP diphosphatase